MLFSFSCQKRFYFQRGTEGLFTFPDLWLYPGFWADIRMARFWLRDDPFERIEALRPGQHSDPGRTAANNHLFVETDRTFTEQQATVAAIHAILGAVACK